MEKPEKLYGNIKQEIWKLRLEGVESIREELNTLKNDIKSKIAKENYRTITGIWNNNIEKFKYILWDDNISIPKNINESIIFIKKILNKSWLISSSIEENNEISIDYLSSIISIQKTNNLKIDAIFGNQMIKYIYDNLKSKSIPVNWFTSQNNSLSTIIWDNNFVSQSRTALQSEIKSNLWIDNLSENEIKAKTEQEYQDLKRNLPEKLELKDWFDFDIQKFLIAPLKDLKKMLNWTMPRNENQLEEFSNYFSNSRQNRLTDEAKSFIINFPDDLENDQNIKNIPIINSQNINDPKIQLAFGKWLMYFIKIFDSRQFSIVRVGG